MIYRNAAEDRKSTRFGKLKNIAESKGHRAIVPLKKLLLVYSKRRIEISINKEKPMCV